MCTGPLLDKPRSLMKLSDIMWDVPVLNCRHLFRVYAQLPFTNDVPEVCHLVFEEVALSWLCIQLMLLQCCEYFSKMILMFFHRAWEDKDVVQVHQDKVVKVWTKHVIHKTLKSGGSVSQAETKNAPLIVTERGAESRFRHICIKGSSETKCVCITPPSAWDRIERYFCTLRSLAELGVASMNDVKCTELTWSINVQARWHSKGSH